jgi:hypothetical protein
MYCRITVGFSLYLLKLIQIWNMFRLAEGVGWKVGSLVGWLVGWLEHLTMF